MKMCSKSSFHVMRWGLRPYRNLPTIRSVYDNGVVDGSIDEKKGIQKEIEENVEFSELHINFTIMPT